MSCATTTASVWPWLEPWWTFWANFTSLIEWKAWAAVGTAAAVIIALRRDSSADRRAWMKERAILLALADYAETVPSLVKADHDVFPIFASADFVPDPKQAKRQAQDEIETGYMRMSLEGLNAIKMTDISTPTSITRWMIARAAIEFVIQEYTLVAKGGLANGAFVKKHASELEKAGRIWREQADKLLKRSHPIRSRIPTLRKRL